jgi:hypothetical protein
VGSIALALALLLAAVFLIPASWFEALFSPLALPTAAELERQRRPVLYLLPVPIIETVDEVALPTDEEEKERPAPPATWWHAAWQSYLGGRSRQQLMPTLPDSTFRLLRDVLQTSASLRAGILAEPDSSLAARLALWRMNNRQQFDQVRDYLLGSAYRANYEKILNQAARLYDDWLFEEIEVPDADRQ